MAAPKTQVGPIRLYGWDDDQRCTIRKVVAYRAECACGWRGSARRDYAAARIEARHHAELHK